MNTASQGAKYALYRLWRKNMQLFTEEKYTALKLWVIFYSETLLRTVVQEAASQTTLRYCSKEVSEEPGYIGILTTNTR